MGDLRRRRVWLWVILPLAGAVGLCGWNVWLSFRCPLWIVNHTPEDAQVLLGGERLLTVTTGGVQSLVLPEGRHTLVIERRVGQKELRGREEVEVELSRGFLERFADRSAFVVNVARAAALRVEEGVFESGRDVAAPAPPRWYTCFSFLRVLNVDLPFQPLPDVVTDGKAPPGGRVTALVALHQPTATIATFMPSELGPAERLEFLELRLLANPADFEAGDLYVELAHELGLGARALELFRDHHRERRPVVVTWHRQYQDLARRLGQEEPVALEYQQLADGSPRDPYLQYLAGRMEPEPEAAEARYARALEVRGELGWAWNGRAAILAARGDIAAAASAAVRGAKGLRGHAEPEVLAYQLRLLAGQKVELLAERRRTERERGLGATGARQLMELCFAAGDVEGGRDASTNFMARESYYPSSKNPAGAQRMLLIELTLAELERRWADLLGDVDGLERHPRARDLLRLCALIETGQLEEAAKRVESDPTLATGREALLLSLAWSLAGDAARAARWREVARERWSRGVARERRAAAAFVAADPLDGLERVALPVHDQAALLLALADANPGARAALLARAAPLVVEGELFPARLLRRAREALLTR